MLTRRLLMPGWSGGEDDSLVLRLVMNGAPGTETDVAGGVPFAVDYGTVAASTEAPAHLTGSYYFNGASWVQANANDAFYSRIINPAIYSYSYWFNRIGLAPNSSNYWNPHMGVGVPDNTTSSGKPLMPFLSSNGTTSFASKLNVRERTDSWKYKLSADLVSDIVPVYQFWHHVAVTANETSLQLYHNGVLAGTAAMQGSTPCPSGAIIRIGRSAHYLTYPGNSWGWCEPFYGYMADFRFYDKVLSSEEVFSIYDGDQDTCFTGLFAEYLLASTTEGCGIAATVNADKSITLNGTVSANTNVKFTNGVDIQATRPGSWDSQSLPALTAGGLLPLKISAAVISGSFTVPQSGSFNITTRYSISDAGLLMTFGDGTTEVTGTPTTDFKMGMIYFRAGTTLNNLTLRVAAELA